MEFLIEPLQYNFMLRGLAGGLLAALACASLSAFVVWRGMSFMGDALAHATLPGIVVAYVLNISLFWGGLGAAVLVVVGIGTISNHGRLKEDAAIGVVFAGFFALGILMLGRLATFVDLGHILFGNILGVSKGDLVIMTLTVVLVVSVTFFSYKEILTASFDPAHAASIGLSPELVRFLLLSVLALTTVVAIQAVGVVLVLALLVTPGAAASMISRRLGRIIALSVVMAAFATVVGFYASYYADVASGPAIVLTLTVMFLFCAAVGKFRSLTKANRR